MGIAASLLFFGIPSVIFCFSIYFIMQKLHQSGVDDFVNFIVSMTTPLAMMLAAAIIAYKVEGIA